VRIQRVVLEDHGDVAVAGGQCVDDLVSDTDDALGDLLEPGDHPERGGLAAPGGPHQDHELPVVDVQVQIGDGPGPVRVDLAYVLEPDPGHACPSANQRGRI
jgi:hypothetical protein